MDFELARQNMVESQIRPNKVTDDRVIQAIASVQRERFVPVALRGVAYVDEDVPIGHSRYLMEPMIFARLLQVAAIQPTDIVLDIGCGFGYSTAVLARLAEMVVAVESDPELAKRAIANLNDLEVDNAVVLQSALTGGAPRQAPYSLVFIGGGVQRVPDAIFDQLADGGRLVTVVNANGLGRAVLARKTGGEISEQRLFDAAVPALPGFETEPTFVF
ncbi:MAG: protein-L-isoaspartate O-methyltransferase family protein [Dongiaceae bacterium]